MIRPWTSPVSPAMQDQALRLASLVPRLVTPRLILRAPQLGDFQAYAEIFQSDRSVHIGGPCSEDDAWDDFCRLCAGWLLRGHGLWSVETQSGALVGFVLIGLEPGDAEPELGWFLVAEAEGNGYATEAAQAARKFGLDVLGLDRLVSYVDPANLASARVAARLGAVVEGQLDGSDVWVHRAIAHGNGSPPTKTDGRRIEDAMTTSQKGE